MSRTKQPSSQERVGSELQPYSSPAPSGRLSPLPASHSNPDLGFHRYLSPGSSGKLSSIFPSHSHTEPTRPKLVDVSSHVSGGKRFSFRTRSFYNAPQVDVEGQGPWLRPVERHRDLISRVTWRASDVERYVSPITGETHRLQVQVAPSKSSSHHTRQGDPAVGRTWRTIPMKSHAPSYLRWSDWCLRPSWKNDDQDFSVSGSVVTFFRLLLVTPYWLFLQVMQILIVIYGIAIMFDPTGLAPGPSSISINFLPKSKKDFQDDYPSFLGKYWEFPLYARNEMDSRPRPAGEGLTREWGTAGAETAVYNIDGKAVRLLMPRALMVRSQDDWKYVEQPTNTRYIFISYAAMHFPRSPDGSVHPILLAYARQLALEKGVKAYWLDIECLATVQPQLTYDVHRICDVVRGAKEVVVILPEISSQRKKEWGARIWTLTEALLAPQMEFELRTPAGDRQTLNLVNFSEQLWPRDEAARILAEHFSGTQDLSPIELMTLGLKALMDRKYPSDPTIAVPRTFMEGDVAYALMALLNQRPQVDPRATEFQALARLSLSNDNERLIERMVSCLPIPNQRHPAAFTLDDALHANLWDIEPLCQVAGIGDGDELILNGCHAMSIRWKDFPEIVLEHDKDSWKRFVVAMIPAIGVVLLIVAALLRFLFDLDYASLPFWLLWALATFASPLVVVYLHNGRVYGSSAWLVAFEGTMDLHALERFIFGNSIGRLTFDTTASTLYRFFKPQPAAAAQPRTVPYEREGVHVKNGELPTRACDDSTELCKDGACLWRTHLPKGERLFTLIDTRTMSVMVFSAKKPPTAALITGHEGGMLRVVLCSFDRSRNALVKQSVLRMDTTMLDHADRSPWLKLAFGD